MNTMNTSRINHMFRIGGLTIIFIVLNSVCGKGLVKAYAGFQQVEELSHLAELHVTQYDDEILHMSIHAENIELIEILHQIADELGVEISINTRNIKDKKVSYRARDKFIYDLLNDLLESTGLEFNVSEDRRVLIIQEAVEKEELDILQETVTGRVIAAETGEALPGVNIVLQGTTTGTSTDADGRFELTVPTLDETLLLTYVGYEQLEVPINGRTELNLEMRSDIVAGEEIRVTSYRRGQARAISRQKEASNIINVIDEDLIATFPDPNVGESLKRIPGINIQNDQGEARYVQIRGTSPSFSSVSINGEQVATPEGGGRAITLDMIPSDLMAEIEVTKAITPDMDADAVGGSVNFTTKNAVLNERIFNVTLNGGYHNQVSELSPMGGRVSVIYGDRLGEEGRFGFMLGANYNVSPIGNDDNEMEYDEGVLETIELRDYELTRDRLGLTSNFDYRLSDNSRLFANASYNFFDDDQIRRILLLETEEIAREYSTRLEENRIISTSAGGEHNLNNGFALDYRVSYSYSDQRKPFDREVVYTQAWEDQEGDDISFISFDRSDPDFPQFMLTNDAPPSAGADNYSAFGFDGYEEANESVSEQHVTTKLDLTKNYVLSDNVQGLFKFGGLARFKSKEQDAAVNVYDGYNGSLAYQDIVSDFEDSDYLFGNYQLGLFPSKSSLRNFLYNNRSDFELHEDDTLVDSNGDDYEATEDTYAGYVMTNMQIGGFGVVLGVRYERLVTDYTGTAVEFDENEEISLSTTSGSNASGYFFPMIHLKYSIGNQANLRFAWTNNFSKPSYSALVPSMSIFRLNETLSLGNPELVPARATNLDLMGEYYLGATGILSAGLFYKQIQDYIYTRSFDFQEAPFAGYRASQPVNGADADLFGFELAYQHNFTFLPGFADGFGIFSNYTYTWSEARIPNEDGTVRTLRLPGQAGNVANFALSYEKYGFSGRVAMNYSAAFIVSVRGSADDDRYYDDHFQVDVSASQYITDNIQIFADVVNLTNEPTRFYNGVTTRPEQQEYFSWWSRLGVKLYF